MGEGVKLTKHLLNQLGEDIEDLTLVVNKYNHNYGAWEWASLIVAVVELFYTFFPPKLISNYKLEMFYSEDSLIVH